MRRGLLIGLLAFVVAMAGCGSSTKEPVVEPKPTTPKFKGVWITSVASQVLNSRDNIKEAVARCEASGINNIFVVVWNKGKTLYPSPLMKEKFGIEIDATYAGRDPLKEMIEEAHAKNIKVHAWFEYGFACSYSQSGGHIIQKYPSWAAKDQNGALVVKNGFDWMNPFLPEVQQFMIDLFTEVVRSYDVDGVQGDDRMPALPTAGGYDEYTVNLYKSTHNGANPPSDYKNSEWLKWRSDLLTEFLGKLYGEVKKLKPNVVVSSAPSIYPWGRDEYLQDWPSWLSKGYVDMVIPQHYRYDINAYQSTLIQQLGYLQPKDRGKFYPGVLIQNGTYNPSDVFLRQMIEENRRQGITGECFWFYEGLSKFPSFFEQYKKGTY